MGGLAQEIAPSLGFSINHTAANSEEKTETSFSRADSKALGKTATYLRSLSSMEDKALAFVTLCYTPSALAEHLTAAAASKMQESAAALIAYSTSSSSPRPAAKALSAVATVVNRAIAYGEQSAISTNLRTEVGELDELHRVYSVVAETTEDAKSPVEKVTGASLSKSIVALTKRAVFCAANAMAFYSPPAVVDTLLDVDEMIQRLYRSRMTSCKSHSVDGHMMSELQEQFSLFKSPAEVETTASASSFPAPTHNTPFSQFYSSLSASISVFATSSIEDSLLSNTTFVALVNRIEPARDTVVGERATSSETDMWEKVVEVLCN